jgi:hypothetical protein
VTLVCVPPLDPIVSLSVALAEAPGSYALLLGSGVSRDAGVPTGAEVYWLAVGDLYRVENQTEETSDEDALRTWLAVQERELLGYSEILELIAPDAATRRDYLAKHFEGIEPGETHERLADLAARGIVRVFVTTNFDRLLERALQARGVEPIVVTSDTDLDVAPGREHSRCYVLKPHGDYLQQTIRNTPAELAALSPAITAELEEVFSRYGLVVLGYAGGDEAIATAMRSRRSRYGVYWVVRADPAEPARTLIEQLDARVIRRAGAAEFLADLERRLAVFAAHPSGETPLTVNDEVVLLLRRNDHVGLRELLRRERREYEQAMLAVVDGRHGEQPTEAVAVEIHGALLPVLERRLASLLPLALHELGLLGEETAALAAFKSRQPIRGGYTFWPSLLDWGAWWMGTVIGAYLMELGSYTALRAVFEPRAAERVGTGSEPLVSSVPGDAGHGIGVATMKGVDDKRYFAPAWESLRRDVAELNLVRDRYPELVSAEDQPLRSLIEFDFVQNIALGLADERALSHWTMYDGAAEALAARLHADARMRERLADGLGLRLDEFDEKAPVALEAAHPFGNFPDRDAIRILRTGSRH